MSKFAGIVGSSKIMMKNMKFRGMSKENEGKKFFFIKKISHKIIHKTIINKLNSFYF